MRRYLLLAFLFCLTLPFDLAVTGCGRNPAANFCENLGYGASTSAISSISFNPSQTGLSIPYGEVGNPQSPTAKSCTGTTVSVKAYSYGTSNMAIADINPTTGQVCAGTWNRQSGSGVAAYTTCLPTNNTGVAYITASAGTVTSNVVPVYVHPPIGSVSLSVTPLARPSSSAAVTCPLTSTDANGCISQHCPATLDITATATGATSPFCAPNSSTLPECSSVLGAITYNPTVGTIATIGTTLTTTNQATANLPGATAITVSTNTGNVNGGTTTSTAGYFYTCPPKTITLTADGGTSNNTTPLPLNPNNPETITAAITDLNDNPVTGISLTYSSTQPENIPVTSAGVITASYPSTASVTAYCLPPTCNPAPISQIGVNGSGTTIVSSPLLLKSTGTSSDILYMGSPKSDYYSAIDFTVGQVSSPIKLPYTPNSMVLDPTGNSLYFGSYHELMVYSVTGQANTLAKEDPTVPGVVLAVSPANTQLLINDQNRGILYLYGVAGNGASGTATGTGTSTGGGSTATGAGIVTTFGGVGQRAKFSPDGNTVYIVGNTVGTATTPPQPALIVHNVFTGWSIAPLAAGAGIDTNTVPATSIANACQKLIIPQNVETSSLGNANPAAGPVDENTQYNTFCSPDLTVAVPAVGPFVSGTTSQAFGFCPSVNATSTVYYPSAGTIQESLDHLVATTNSLHLIGASASPAQLTDTATVIPTGECPLQQTSPGSAPTSSALSIPTTLTAPQSLAAYNITNIDQVIASPDSTLAFVTYTGTNTAGTAKLPAYTIPAPGATGTLTGIPLSGTATSPIAGVFNTNSQTFYVSTTGDNLVHLISTSSLTDTATLAPGLPDANGKITPAQFLATKARSQP